MSRKKAETNGKVERMVPSILKDVRVTGPTDPTAEMACPHLLQLLMPLYDGEGKLQREAGTLFLTARGSVWSVRVNCPSEGYACDLLITSIAELASLVEAALCDNRVVWQHDSKAQKKARQRLAERLK